MRYGFFLFLIFHSRNGQLTKHHTSLGEAIVNCLIYIISMNTSLLQFRIKCNLVFLQHSGFEQIHQLFRHLIPRFLRHSINRPQHAIFQCNHNLICKNDYL